MTEHETDAAKVPEPFAGSDVGGLAAPNRGEPELVVLADPDAVAREAADRIAVALIAAVKHRGRADFCTAGGTTPIPIYRLLARPPLRDRIAWPQVHVWFGDDRFVPRDHPESNVTPLDDVLLGGGAEEGGVPLPAANIHAFQVDRAIAETRDNAWCAARYAEDMAANLPLAEGNWPVFDLILVGVGTDGHVLSCFPDSPALYSLAWTLGVPAPSHIGPHLPRMTMNPRLLEQAPVLVVTWGAGKAQALSHVFGEIRDGRRWPVQRTRRTGAVWLIDEAAAVDIPGRRR